MSRFDDIAEVYDAEIPEHVRLHLLARKTDMMTPFLGQLDKAKAIGLDLGCGTGWHVQRLREKGFLTQGIDNSVAQLRAAQDREGHFGGGNCCWCLGDIHDLPYADRSVDFAFAVNAVHHLDTREMQQETVQEIRRVLKPGGLFFLHEINTTNIVMSIYMNYLFPKIRRIDDGSENWILPASLHHWPGFEVIDITPFTFVPDFVPKALFSFLCWMERWLEKSPLRGYAAHYMAVLRVTT